MGQGQRGMVGGGAVWEEMSLRDVGRASRPALRNDRVSLERDGEPLNFRWLISSLLTRKYLNDCVVSNFSCLAATMCYLGRVLSERGAL